MVHLQTVACFLLLTLLSLASAAKAKAKGCTDTKDKLFQVDEKYIDGCDIFTCIKSGKKFSFKKTFNSTHCCQGEDDITYLVGERFNTSRLNSSCSYRQQRCQQVGNLSEAAVVVTTEHHGLCCAYRHIASNYTLQAKEFYNGTLLNMNSNFTLYLEVNESLVIPEKCLNLTCIQDSETAWGLPVLSADIVDRACNCCYYNGSLYKEGARNITLLDGRNASCCGGELVLPDEEVAGWVTRYRVTNSSLAHNSSRVYNGSTVTVEPSPTPSQPDASLCHSTCFKLTNSYHNQFLTIISALQTAQSVSSSQGVAFVLDSSLHNSSSTYLYQYERNLATLLALTLPVSSTNPMFVTKFSNYGSCSWYDPAWCCKTDKCEAARTLAGPSPPPAGPSIATHQQVNGTLGYGRGQAPYMGMLWHGTGLAHGAFNDTERNSCAGTTKNQLVVPIINKEWHQAMGGGGAFEESWFNGTQGQGRTVAAIGIDQAPLGPLQQAATDPKLAWRVGSTQDWHLELVSLLECLDTAYCAGGIAPKERMSLSEGQQGLGEGSSWAWETVDLSN